MKATPRLSTFEEYEAELGCWLERLKLVDTLLERPALTLIEVVERARKHARSGGAGVTPGDAYDPALFKLPTTIGQVDGRPGSRLLAAACCSTVQRLDQRRRHFPWLAKQPLSGVPELYGPFIAIDKRSRARDAAGRAMPSDAARLYAEFRSEALPPMIPLTSAEMFWVLVKAGEKYAHGAIGFFCLFNMLWTLGAHRDDHLAENAADPRDRPTPFIVAKCLQPIRVLCDILRHRAELYRLIDALVDQIDRRAAGRSQRDRWLLVGGLERLASALSDFASVAANPSDYTRFANRITAIADSFTTELPKAPKQSWKTVRSFLCKLLGMSHAINERILRSAVELMNSLKPVARSQDRHEAADLLKALIGVDDFDVADDESNHRLAAYRSAFACCWGALTSLRAGVRICRPYSQRTEIATSAQLSKSLKGLAAVNERVARRIERAVERNTHLLRRVITREVASASAGDQTNFDPADLVAALGTVERWLRISDLEVDDALKWSVAGAHPDGSWSSRHPISMSAASSTLWPGTSEIVWMLTMAIERKSRLRTADGALYAYIQWLDRTRIDIRPQNAQWISGWPSEARAPEVIDLAATMSAVNALLSIRDVIEERLWEICEQRFTVKLQTKSLLDIDPVDLGARHSRRLHRRLMRMARETLGPDYANAEYSLVLHGPPGSSKTAVAEALAGEMWSRMLRGHRLVRVTPADFTRQGEARLDSEARFIFDLLSHIRGATIVFDEIDDLLRKRQPEGAMSFLRLVVPAMLNRLQDLRDAAPKQEICFVFATNYIDSIEPALTRPGRFDATVPVPYPDAWSRENILLRNIEQAARQVPDREVLIDRAQQPALIAKSSAWPFSTFDKMCRELTTNPAGTAKDIVVQIERHKEAVDDSISYYLRADRWKDVCRPLENELFHAMFALEDLTTAKKTVTEVVNRLGDAASWLEKGKPSHERLEELWGRESRPGRWQPNPYPAPPRRQIKGTSLRMGATVDDRGTTFRVWAPFAIQMSVRGDAFDNWHQPMDMQPLRELPGVWEMTADWITPQVVRDREAAGDPPFQYRYVVPENSEISDPYRSDPYAREWAATDINGTEVINAAIALTSDAASRQDLAAKDKLVVCRICLSCLDSDQPFESARNFLPCIKEIGFTAIEIGPHCVNQCDERRWGYDRRHPYGLGISAGGTRAMRSLIEDAHRSGLEVIMRSAWGYFGDGGPLAWFDGWSSPIYKKGIYFSDCSDGNTACLDLDEPYVCNMIFDHAVECVEQYGVAGVHLIFAPVVAEHEKPQAASLANDLARRLNDSKSYVLIDSTINMNGARSGSPAAIPCFDAAEWIERRTLPSQPFDMTLSTAVNDDRGAMSAVLAFSLPVIPVITWTDHLQQRTERLPRLLQDLVRYRAGNLALVEATSTRAEDAEPLVYRGTADGAEAMVVVNAGNEAVSLSLSDGDLWRTEVDSAWPAEIGSTSVAPMSARIMTRR